MKATNVSAEKALGLWHVPTRGVMRAIPIEHVPDDALWDSLNVVVRKALLQTRPGLTVFAPTTLGDRPIGSFSTVTLATGAFQADAFQNDAFQVSGNVPAFTLVVATTKKIWAFYAGIWHDITDTPLTALSSSHARFTSIEIGGTIFTLHTNGVDAPRQWDGAAATVSVVAGNPKLFTDWTNIADHIIGIVPPYTIRWSDTLSISSWPDSNGHSLAETTDPLVAVRNLGFSGGVVYKAATIWRAVSGVGGTEASFFRFELVGYYEGPVSPSAIVDVDGVHYYLTPTGRLGMFNGSRHEWVADGIYPLIREDIDQANAGRCFGVYDPLNDEVTFFYPRMGDNGDLKGAIILIPPKPAEAISDHIAFPVRLERPVSAATSIILGDRKALVFGSTSQQSYEWKGASDDGLEFTGFWQSGLVTAPQIEVHRLDNIETFVQRGVGFGRLTMRPVTSYVLDTEGGTLGPEAEINLTESPVKDPKGVDATGRFFGIRYEFTTPVTLRWRGARLAGYKLEGR